MCWKLADLPVCLVFIRSLSPWYFSSLSENKTGDTGSQGNLERKAITVIYSNKIWWPRHNLERLMTRQCSRPASWEALGTPQFSPWLHLAQGIYPALPSSQVYRVEAGSAAEQRASGEGRARAWPTSTASSSTPPRPACFLQGSLTPQPQKGAAKSWKACTTLHDSSCVQEIGQRTGKLKKQAAYGGRQ